MPKISIVIPIFNAADSIGACFDSILAQTMPDLEVICVNDGSTDDTESCLERYSRTDSRIRCLSFRRNSKSVIARKRGVLDAAGDYIMFADADDLLMPDACEKLLALMERTHADVLQFAVRIETEKEDGANPIFESFFTTHDLSLTAPDILSNCYIKHRFSHNLWNKICRADLCRKAFDAMPDCRLHHYEDMYALFFVLYHASAFRSVKNEEDIPENNKNILNNLKGKFQEIGDAYMFKEALRTIYRVAQDAYQATVVCRIMRTFEMAD